jgi:hypothetical protein
MSSALRTRIIRLAHSRPDLRPHLLPILAVDSTRIAASYQEYVDRKKKEGEKPLPKEDWEKRVHGGASDSDSGSKKKTPAHSPKDAKSIQSATKFFAPAESALERLEKQAEKALSYKGDPKKSTDAHRKAQEVLERAIEHAAEVDAIVGRAAEQGLISDKDKATLSKAVDKARELWSDNKGKDDKARSISGPSFVRDVGRAVASLGTEVVGLSHLADSLGGGRKASEGDAVAGSDGYYMTAQYLRQIADQARELADAVPAGRPLPDWFEAKAAQAAGTVRDLHGYLKYQGG